ncbi:MAG: cytochrome c1 [Dokdonella sp.]|uniref:cytochrome c1 n=1 Tax=Dokdonella sp. TaxID=2291710 RepID=UPI002C582950|nr:cytochrome c1 [Dokdonella sp.]HPN80850.1 cytochrome c1 [Dokdonella sp.]
MTETIMQKTPRWIAGLLVGALLAVAPAMASEEGALASSNASLSDLGSLQNGAKMYFNYCSGCHSLKLMRYSRIADDLQLSKEQVMQNFNFTGANFGEQIPATMSAEDGKTWFGAAPPDLSLMARAKGVDYIYNYLKSFYLDSSRPIGWNNTVFPNASMPNPLWELQGIQTAKFKPAEGDVPAEFEKFEIHQAGTMNAEEFNAVARDVANFLQYAAEPAALQRKSIGIWVLLFLSVFSLLAYFLKQEYWKDVH